MRRWLGQHTAMVGLLLGIVLVMATPALAYILPAKFYLNKTSSQRAKFRRLRVKQTTTVIKDGSKVEYEETVWFSSPGKIRRERFLGGKKVQVDVWSDTNWMQWRKSTGETKRGARTPQPALDLFAVEPSGSGFGGIYGMMAKLGVNWRGQKQWSRFNDYRVQTRVGLGLLQGNIAVVLGTSDPKSKRNQMWLDSKRYVPLRFVGKLGTDPTLVDVKFLDYIEQTGKAVFPGRIEVFWNGKLRSQTLVSEAKKLRSIANNKFSQLP